MIIKIGFFSLIFLLTYYFTPSTHFLVEKKLKFYQNKKKMENIQLFKDQIFGVQKILLMKYWKILIIILAILMKAILLLSLNLFETSLLIIIIIFHLGLLYLMGSRMAGNYVENLSFENTTIISDLLNETNLEVRNSI